jgi:hypothetical protein
LSPMIFARTQVNLINDSPIKESQNEKKFCNSSLAINLYRSF